MHSTWQRSGRSFFASELADQIAWAAGCSARPQVYLARPVEEILQ